MAKKHYTGRRIKQNHSSTLPRYIIAVATETDRKKSPDNPSASTHRLKMGAAMFVRLADNRLTSQQSLAFSTGRQFWDWVYSLAGFRQTTWIVGHNVLYDMLLTGFADEVSESRLALSKPRASRSGEGDRQAPSSSNSLCVLDSPPCIIGLQSARTGGRLVVVDILNWFRCSIDELAKSQSSHDEPTGDLAGDCKRNDSGCIGACETIANAFAGLMRWAAAADIGVFKYTAAGQAMAAFRHRFMKREIFVHDSDDVRKLERQSYFGGRTEVFRLGKIEETVHHVDINSLFPWAMRFSKVPYRLVRSETEATWTDRRPAIQLSSSVCVVIVRTDKSLFPLRTTIGVSYPVGRFATTLCGEELRHAAETGRVVAFRNWATYDCDILFGEFVDYFYALRKEYKATGRAMLDTFAKSILNSLYGKFAQLAPRWADVPGRLDCEPWSRWCEVDRDSGQLSEMRSVGYCVQRKMPSEPHSASFTAISAFITAAARRRMNILREIAGAGTVLYQGVDGLIVTDAGYRNLADAGEIDATEIGKLRLIVSANHGHIYGAGDYRTGGKVAIGGLPRRHTIGGDGSILARSFAARGNLFASGSKDYVTEVEQGWRRATRYVDRQVTDSGWIVPESVDYDPASEVGIPCGTDEACSANRSTTPGNSLRLFPE